MNLAWKSLHGVLMQNEKEKYTAPGQGMRPERQEWILASERELVHAVQVQICQPQEKLRALNQDWILPNTFPRQKKTQFKKLVLVLEASN